MAVSYLRISPKVGESYTTSVDASDPGGQLTHNPFLHLAVSGPAVRMCLGRGPLSFLVPSGCSRMRGEVVAEDAILFGAW